MNQHERIVSNLRGIQNYPHINKYLKVSGDIVSVLGGEGSIVKFGKTGINVGNSGELLQLPETPSTDQVKSHTLADVLKALGVNQASLNHVGIGYNVANVDAEIQRLTHLIQHKSRYHLYEDKAGIPESMRWLFIGDKQSDAPMCEIVLPFGGLQMRPHMQFDIDTELTPEDIGEKMETAFGKDVLDWHLDIEGDRVLSMGTYENRAIDLRIGIGSNLRNKEAQREPLVKIS